MPFSDVAAHFKPEQVGKLVVAFGAAWQHLLVSEMPTTPLELERLRQQLTQHLLASASTGEFDPQKLTEMALRALMKRRRFSLNGGAPNSVM